MGHAHDAARTGSGAALIEVAKPPAGVRSGRRLGSDVLVLVGLATLLVAAAISRQEFLGDGVRHLPAILSNHIEVGEPRWFLFPVVAHLWVHTLSALGLVHDAESTLRALLALCVGSGVVFLRCLLIWIRAECDEPARRTAALLLAGSSAPCLMLFSDIAEPQLAAALVLTGLTFARVHRDDARRGPVAVVGAAAAIVVASLIYQGVILALGMLPIVAPQKRFGSQSGIALATIAVVAMAMVMIVAQIAVGTPTRTAIALIFSGEANPMTRTFMASSSPLKYIVALVMGAPQGIVALENFGGMKALWHALRSCDTGTAAANAALNVALLCLGLTITTLLLLQAILHRQWRVLLAAAVLLALPIFRNQQYGYVKYYVLWPIPVALTAIRCRARTIAILATVVLVVNGCLLAEGIRHGRERFAAATMAYARASPSTCWLTSGWSAPFPYRWPGTTAPILGLLATGSEPARQAAVLTGTLRRCLCDSTSVWTDTLIRDTDVVRSIAQHFGYTAIDLASVLLDPTTANGDPPMPGVLVYSEASRARACRALNP